MLAIVVYRHDRCDINNQEEPIMSESIKVKQSLESFKQYLSEAVNDKDAILLGEDGNMYLAGIVGIVQEVTQGLIPLFIARTVSQIAKTKQKLEAENYHYLTIFDSKHNLTDDEPRGEQIVFNWGFTQDLHPAKHKWLKLEHDDNSPIMVESSFSLVGEIRHRGWQLLPEEQS